MFKTDNFICNVHIKPPLGVMPEWFWLESHNFYSLNNLVYRHTNLDRAIKQRLSTEFEIPNKWLIERSKIATKIAKDRIWAYDPLGISIFAYKIVLKILYKIQVEIEDMLRTLT